MIFVPFRLHSPGRMTVPLPFQKRVQQFRRICLSTKSDAAPSRPAYLAIRATLAVDERALHTSFGRAREKLSCIVFACLCCGCHKPTRSRRRKATQERRQLVPRVSHSSKISLFSFFSLQLLPHPASHLTDTSHITFYETFARWRRTPPTPRRLRQGALVCVAISRD